MKKKEIEKIPWISKKFGKQMSVTAKIFDLNGEKTLIVDVTKEVPVIRICLTKSDYANYLPIGSLISEGKTWSYKNIENLSMHHKLGKPRTHISQECEMVIHKFTNNNYRIQNWESEISNMQQGLACKKTRIAEERRYKRIKERMKTVSKEPDGFEKWAYSMIKQHRITILPFRKNKTTRGVCSACGKENVYQKGTISPKDTVKCPNCGAEAIVKRVDWEHMNPFPVEKLAAEILLFQRTSEGFVERHFVTWKDIGIHKETHGIYEKGRIFRVENKTYTYYAKQGYGDIFWDDKNLYGMYSIVLCNGPVYIRNITQKMFEGTQYKYCSMELLKNEQKFAPVAYLTKYEEMPQLEMMVKVGLKKLAIQISKYDFVEGNKPWEILGINKKQFNRMREINGGRLELLWMEYEMQKNRIMENKVIQWLSKNYIKPQDIGFINDRMSETKICNYLQKQYKLHQRKPNELIETWKDYLSMANRLKMDIKHELIYKPKDLLKSHNEAVSLCGGQAIAKRVAEIAGDYPDIDNIYQSIKAKYEFSGKEYIIVVPEKIEDIIKEGRVLGHCLDSSNIYFDRIQRRESYIVFLRKKEDPEQPYYTLEIEPGGATRQKRTVGDKQNKDFEEAKIFIRKWQFAIQNKLTQKDKELAETSAVLRVEELKELRKTKVKIWHGSLAGQLLADVLEADLMEIQLEEAI